MIYHCIQDKEGFMWLATELGICKFDGINFKSYDSPLLKNNVIIRITNDDIGRIWIQNLSEELLYIEDETIKDFHPDFFPEKLRIKDIIWLNGEYWISTTDHGIYQFKIIDKKPILINQYLTDKRFIQLQNSLDGTLYAFAENYLYVFDLDVGDFVNLKHFSNPIPPIYFFNSSTNGVYINYHPDNRIIMVNKNDCDTILPKYEPNIDFIKIKENKNILINPDGFFIFNETQECIDSFSIPNISYDNLKIYEDLEGNFWLYGNNEGLFRVFKNKVLQYNTQNSNLPGNHITNILKFDEDHFLTTSNYGWLSLFKNGMLKQNFNLYEYIEDKLKKDDFYSIIKNHDDILTLAFPYILMIEDITKPSRKFYNNKAISEKYELKNISPIQKTFLLDHNDHIWVGHSHGVNLNIQNDLTSLIDQRTYNLYEAKDGRVWIGSTAGLYLSDEDSTYFYQINGQSIDYNINDIEEDSEGRIWLATINGVYAVKGEKILHFSTSEGLNSNIINDLYIDSNNNIWVATNQGLNRLDYPNYQSTAFDAFDGLKEKNILAVYKDKQNQKIWLGTSKGLISIDHLNEKDQKPPPIFISGFQINEIDTTLLPNYELNHDENNLFIVFGSIYFNSKNKFVYQLEGVDEKWIETNDEHVRYPNLPSGNYTFNVFAVDKNNIKSPMPASIKIKIHPHWTKSKWFFWLTIFSTGFLISVLFLWRDRQLKAKQIEENKIAQKIATLELNTLQAQMNPHFIFNALNAIQDFIIEKDLRSTNNYLSKFSKLIRAFLESTRSKFIFIEEEIRLIELYLELEQLRFSNSFIYEIHIDPQIEPGIVEVPAMIIQPFVENAIIHGIIHKNKDGKIKISFKKDNNNLVIEVLDNGIGINKSIGLSKNNKSTHISRALEIMEERIQVLNTLENHEISYKITDLNDLDASLTGTQVQIVFNQILIDQ